MCFRGGAHAAIPGLLLRRKGWLRFSKYFRVMSFADVRFLFKALRVIFRIQLFALRSYLKQRALQRNERSVVFVF